MGEEGPDVECCRSAPDPASIEADPACGPLSEQCLQVQDGSEAGSGDLPRADGLRHCPGRSEIGPGSAPGAGRSGAGSALTWGRVCLGRVSGIGSA